MKYYLNLWFFTVLLFLSNGLSSCTTTPEVKFIPSELKSKFEEILLFDFNGDELEDIVLIDKQSVVLFFQDPQYGFHRSPQITYSISDGPAILWPMEIKDNPSIFIMTNNGISQLTYSCETTLLTREKIIDTETLIPNKAEDSSIIFFKLCANTTDVYPVIIIPVHDCFDIWKYAENKGWYYVASLEGSKLHSTIRLSENQRGYIKEYCLDMNIDDIDGDGREDIVICENTLGQKDFAIKIFKQTSNSSFSIMPVKFFEMDPDEQLWVCFKDINRDGKADLIKNTWVKKPGFIPGVYSGKVIVNISLSVLDNNWLSKIGYIFRKNDWMPFIPIVDVDMDGYNDLVLGHHRWKGRDDFIKSLTTKIIDYNLRFYFYDNNGFLKEPNCQKDITICLNNKMLYTDLSVSDMFRTFVNIEGDFNGDGKRDLLVKNGNKNASVYFFRSRDSGFSKVADIKFNVYKVKQFIVKDLNKDGISDLIVILPEGEIFNVFLSKKG